MSRIDLDSKIVQFPSAFIVQPTQEEGDSLELRSKIVDLSSRIHQTPSASQTDLTEKLSIPEPEIVLADPVRALANLISAAHHRGVETAPFVPESPFDRV